MKTSRRIMSGLGEGSTHANRSSADPMYMKNADMGLNGGGTVTGTSTNPTIEQYENIFGPAGRDIKLDSQRHKRHQRWHLPDALKGANTYLTDRVDGLITDSTNSPFTTSILPYVYLDQPDQKLKWNVYSFDEGIASRVPYEAAARVLPQTKRSFAGYTVRQGLAIAMEHNFMVSAAGRENFKNQLTQLVGSIQLTNDLDVHVALLQAPSYQKHVNEKYHDTVRSTAQICRQYVDMFGIMQKVPNALDLLIADAKNHLKTWGSQPPTFLLCNANMTAQLQLNPERTNYITNGPDGLKRLRQGPDLPTYRDLSIIHSRKFSMDSGTAPRDLLRRRVRVAEYYRIPWHKDNATRMYEFYDQSRDSMFRLSWEELQSYARLDSGENLHRSGYWSEIGNADHKIEQGLGRLPLLYLGGTWKVAGMDIRLPPCITKNDTSFTCPQRNIDDSAVSLLWKNCQLYQENLNCPVNLTYSLRDLQHYNNDFLNFNADRCSMSQTFGMGIYNDTIRAFDNELRLTNIKYTEGHAARLLHTPYFNTQAALNASDNFFKTWLTTHTVLQMVNTNAFFFMEDSQHAYLYDFKCLESNIKNGTGKITSPHLVNTMFVYTYLRREHAPMLTLNQDNENPKYTSKYSLYNRQKDIKDDIPGSFFHNANYDKFEPFQKTMQHLEREHHKVWWLKLFWEFAAHSLRLQTEVTIEHVANVDITGRNRFSNFREAVADLGTSIADINNLFAKFVDKCKPFSDNILSSSNFTPEELWTDYTQHPKLIELFWAPTDPDEVSTILNCPNVKLHNRSIVALCARSSFFHGSNPTEDQEQIVRHALKAWNRYNQVIAQWAGDIFWHRMWKELTGSNLDDNVERRNDFDRFHHAILTDCISQTAARHKTRPVIAKGLADGELRRRFLEAGKSNNLEYRIASNVDNCYPMTRCFRPNLHLSSCVPLTSSMANQNATSMNSTTWMIQHAAGMMVFTPLMCMTLLHQVESAAGMSDKIAAILNVPSSNELCSTFLLVEWLTRTIPDLNADARTEGIPSPCRKQFCEAFSKMIADNCVFSTELEESVTGIQGCEPPNIIRPEHMCCVEPAAVKNMYIPRFSTDETIDWCVDTDIMSITDNIPYAAPLCSMKFEDPDCREGQNIIDGKNSKVDSWLQCPSVKIMPGKETCYRWDVPINVLQPDMTRQKKLYDEHGVWQPATKHRWMQYLGLSSKHGHKSNLGSHKFPIDLHYESKLDDAKTSKLYAEDMHALAQEVANFVRNPENFEHVMKEVTSVWASRFFKPASRFMNDGQGKVLAFEDCEKCTDMNVITNHMFQNMNVTTVDKYIRPGISFLHGPNLATQTTSSNGDIVILRPNIEHEMLGVIIGRGGTQELGATFWGQTELSCYDDAQHGIWGMSYKYHERAMVTNERNLIRAFDVCFDGYNGGMDQEVVDWNDAESRQKFRTATYARDQAYNGPSMLVMQLPSSSKSVKHWPNPIAFHNSSDTMSATPDPLKDNVLPNVSEHMVFSSQHCPSLCNNEVEFKYKEYMKRLDMQLWGSVDQSGRPAGDCCVSNETASHMLAFQGTMNIYSQNGTLIDAVQGSGHLGQSFVGVASVREGRGLSTPAMMPTLVRQT